MDDKRAGREKLVIEVGEGRIHIASRGTDLSKDWEKVKRKVMEQERVHYCFDNTEEFLFLKAQCSFYFLKSA